MTGDYHHDLGITADFSKRTPEKEKIDKLFYNLRTPVHQKYQRANSILGKNIFNILYKSTKDFFPEYIKNSYKSINKAH